jgi:hypothetical protein
MAKSNREARRRKARQAKRNEKAAGKAERIIVSRPKVRVPLDFVLRRAGNEGNIKKRQNKAACRQKVTEE